MFGKHLMKNLPYLVLGTIIVAVLVLSAATVEEIKVDLQDPANEYAEKIQALCDEYGLYECRISIGFDPDKSTSMPHYIVNLHAEAPRNLNGEQLLEFLEKFKRSGGEENGNVFFVEHVYLDNYLYTTRDGIIYKDGHQHYPEPTPEPSPTPKPVSNFRPYISQPDSDPYNAKDYTHPDDFYYDYYDEFFDYEEGEDYYNEYAN